MGAYICEALQVATIGAYIHMVLILYGCQCYGRPV